MRAHTLVELRSAGDRRVAPTPQWWTGRHPKPPGAVTSYRCVEHGFRPGFYLVVEDRRARPREHVEGLSRRGCTAYEWIVHMRDRGLTAHCYELDRSSNNDEPKIVPDGLDMRGQPGVPGAQ